MRVRLFSWISVLILMVGVGVLASCGDDDDDDDGAAPAETTDQDAEAGDAAAGDATDVDADAEGSAPTAAPEPTATPEPAPTAQLPADVVEATGGDGVAQPLFNAPLPEGWTETEYLFGGEAVGYSAEGELTEDGFWSATADGAAPYRTRMIVRTPPAADFSGVVLVEWLNVTAGTDSSVDWGYVSEELARSGNAYVGVSVQAVGVNGAEGGRLQEGLVDTRGLVVRDPDRYGTLEHPGDAFAFDIFTQAGAAVAASGTDGVDVLGGLAPTHVIAAGESQSAGFLTTYVNAVHPLAGLYDGFLIHSRGSGAPSPEADREATEGLAVRVRTDLAEPVFIFQAETDINVLGYARARQDDTGTVVTWEVAGTSHSDAWGLGVSGGIEPDASLGVFIGCQNPINDGPHHETLQAAVRHLAAWVADATPPPTSPRIEVDGLDGDGDLTIVRDDLGIAVGGVRTPPVDAPIRVLVGDPSGEDEGFCFLFGQTLPLEPELLVERYGDLAGYEIELRASADAAVAAGWLISEDADDIIAEELERAAELGLE